MIGKSSRNADRKAAYARMASEGDKEARNREISNALGEGAANVEAEGKWTFVETETYISGENAGDDRVVKRRERVMTSKEIIIPKLPVSTSRSAKRARLKARKVQLVADYKHPFGPCGNIGCYNCNPHPKNRPHAVKVAERLASEAPRKRKKLGKNLDEIRGKLSRSR